MFASVLRAKVSESIYKQLILYDDIIIMNSRGEHTTDKQEITFCANMMYHAKKFFCGCLVFRFRLCNIEVLS